MNRLYESYLYAALALCIMPKLIMSAPPFRNYDTHSGYDCPMRPRPGEKYVLNSQLSYHWCLSRPVVSENFASMTCRMKATRSGSIVGVSSYSSRNYRPTFRIRSSYGTTKHRSSTIFNCEDIRQGDSIEWTDTADSYKLYQYLCFSNASCPVASRTTTANHDNHNLDWFGSSWFYWGPGVMICMVVGCIFYRRHRMRQILLQRQRQQAMINDGGVNMVTTVTTNNTATPVVAVAAHPGPEAYPVAVATAQPMPQAGAPPVAHAVAQPVGAPMAVATAVPVQATAVPVGQPQVFL